MGTEGKNHINCTKERHPDIKEGKQQGVVVVK